MSCRSCGSDNQSAFNCDINIHFPQNLSKATRAFPELVICLDCGFTEFRLAETELRQVAEGKGK